MASAQRPKPWEVSSGTSSAVASGQPTDIPSLPSATSSVGAPTPITDSEPSIPERPSSLTTTTSATHSPYGYADGLGSSYGGLGGLGGGLGSYGGYGSSMYGSGMGGYNRYGSMYGGGLGGYGSMYGGGMGSLYGGMGGYGGYGQQPGGPGGFAESTQATFQLIESIIGAFGGFAQMLEATYMATHSSFFTMISVAEQFGHLKEALGSFLGIFALIKYFKKILAKITGKTLRDNIKIDAQEFAKFEAKSVKDKSKPNAKRISLKPLLIFLVMVIGTPWILKKLIAHLSKQKQISYPGQTTAMGHAPPIDLAKVEFGRALYHFIPENQDIELELKEGDLVAILSKLDPMGKPSQWWRVRSRDGRIGYIPSNYVEIIKRKQIEEEIGHQSEEQTVAV